MLTDAILKLQTKNLEINKEEKPGRVSSFPFSIFSFRCAVIKRGQPVITNIKLMNDGIENISLAF